MSLSTLRRRHSLAMLIAAFTLTAAFTLCGLIACRRPNGDSAPGGAASNPAAPQREAESGKAASAGPAAGASGAKDVAEDGRDDDALPPHTKHTNRLADETSPYLLLHAHNPVDWYPWGEAAFAEAKEENKPIFLSVGYSSCYWCHVMERESFMDEEIAAYLNEHFVCVKVDREERPDVDEIYMTAVQLLRQRGGWPLSVFLTPEGKPFFGGTYWPAREGERGSSVGFLDIIKMVHQAWAEKQELIKKDADNLAAAVRESLRGRKASEEIELDHAMITGVWQDLQDDYDPKWGGFGYSASNPDVPKFPEPSNLLFLIDRVQRKDVDNWEHAREMLTHTLDKMAQGAIYDHLGGGFHRYSTDRYWHIPHFEKMLYDNGQLATVYAEAYKLTGNEEYRYVVNGILEFVQREMTHDGGAFYAALDAETDEEEGKFYRWTKEELDECLSPTDRKWFGEIYNLNGEPNFEEKYYVPLLTKPLSDHAAERDMKLDELIAKLKPTRERLFAVRQTRKRPLTDTKILTSWNGLMIRGFADAGRLLEDDEQLQHAKTAAEFVLANLRTNDGRLLRTHTAGEAKLNAYLDDYAFLADGLIALHRATGDKQWLTAAQQLTDKQIELFWDNDAGGFFFTSDDHEALIARAKDPVDTVMPSGNSVSAGNLLYLAEKLEGEEAKAYREKARQTMLAAGVYLRASPGAVPRMAVHLAEYLERVENEPPENDDQTPKNEASTSDEQQ